MLKQPSTDSLKISPSRIATLLVLALGFCFWSPRPPAASPGKEAAGKDTMYPVGPPMAASGERFRIGTFSSMDQLFPSSRVRRGSEVYPLKKVTKEPPVHYAADGRKLTIDDYLHRNRVSGLLVIKDGRILVERYRYDRKDTDRFVSNSIAKSITGLAVGLALRDGTISSLDDRAAKYVPELAESAYGGITIRNLLRMSSGVRFSEDYSGDDDVPALVRKLASDGAVEALKQFRILDAAEGTKFSYASSSTLALGLVVRASTGRSLSEYISEKIWRPMGAESDAAWVVDPKGMEWSFAKFNAVLRDYGRLGWLLANNGVLNGQTILPYDYLIEATDWHRHPEALRPGKATPDLGYGYHFWTLPGEKRRFALMGNFGQLVYVDPGLKLVIVQTAAASQPFSTTMWHEFEALTLGIIATCERLT